MEFVSEQEILKAQEKVAQVDFSMQVSKMIRLCYGVHATI